MTTNVFAICDAYESGMGKGLQGSTRLIGAFADPDCEDAYQIGFALGLERSIKELKSEVNELPAHKYFSTI